MARAIGAYVRENPKYRRAWIQDRLREMKAERQMLLAERDILDQKIGLSLKVGSAADAEVVDNHSNGLFKLRV